MTFLFAPARMQVQSKFAILVVTVAEKGIVMQINNNHISHIRIYFIMLLFTVCLAMNTLIFSNYSFYELPDKTDVTDTCKISENIAADEVGDNAACFKSSLSDKNDSEPDTEIITDSICPILKIAAIPKRFSLSFFVFETVLLSDRWTLINQKVRLDN